MQRGGEWTFLLRAGTGFQLRWREQGARYEDCWRRSRTTWHCGAGTTEVANGFVEATLPFVPGTIASAVRVAVAAGSHARLVVRQQSGGRFGPLSCLTSSTREAPAGTSVATWCLNRHGIPVSEQVHGSQAPSSPWRSLRLMRYRHPAPTADFAPLAPTTAAGVLPPL